MAETFEHHDRQHLLRQYYALRRNTQTEEKESSKACKKKTSNASSQNKFIPRKATKSGTNRARQETLLVAMMNQTQSSYNCLMCKAKVVLPSFGPVSCTACNSHVVVKPRSIKSVELRAV
jgi:DNA-directed RNA polymerase subunit RPC12/RpoP